MMSIRPVQAMRGIDGQLVAVQSVAVQEAFEYNGNAFATEQEAKAARELDQATVEIRKAGGLLTERMLFSVGTRYCEPHEKVKEFVSDFVHAFCPEFSERSAEDEKLFEALWKANEAYARRLNARAHIKRHAS